MINGKIYLHKSEVLLHCGVSDDSLRTMNKRNRQGKSKNWQAYVDGNQTFILLNSIPEKYQPIIKEKLCHGLDPLTYYKSLEADKAKHELDAKRENWHEQVSIDPVEKEEFIKITKKFESFTLKMAHEHALACAYARFYTSTKPSECKSFGFANKAELRNAIHDRVKDLGLHPFKGLENIDRFGRKLTAYSKKGFKALLSKRWGNENRKIIGKSNSNDIIMEFHEATLLAIYANEGNPEKFRHIESYYRYKFMCEEKGIEPVSLSTAKRFWMSDKVQAITAKARHGSKYSDDFWRPYVRREKAQKANLFISGDGVVGDVSYVTDSGIRTMMKFWIWMDWFSGAIVGFDIDNEETTAGINRSLRMMLNLNGGFAPIQLQSDNSSAITSKATKELLSKVLRYSPMGEKGLTLAKVGNAKEKPVERVIPVLNDIFRNYPNWKGCNITSKSIESKANPDTFPTNKELPNESQVRQQIFETIQIYNNTIIKGESRIKRYLNNIHKDCMQVGMLEQSTLFDQNRISTIRRGIVSINVNKQVFEYEVPKYHELLGSGAIRNKGKVRVYFDIDNMDQVNLFNYLNEDDTTQDSYLSTCSEINKVNGSKYEMTALDNEHLGHHKKRGNDFDEFQELKIKEAQLALSDEINIQLPFTAGNTSRFKTELDTSEARMYERYYRDAEKSRGRKVELPRQTVTEGLYDANNDEEFKPLNN